MPGRTLYKNAEGKRVPSVTTIISRFKESGGLLHWANQAGLDGLTLDEARVPAATAGTMAHSLVEAHLHGDEEFQLEGDKSMIEKAHSAFEVFLQWQRQTSLTFQHTEVALVSEAHQFGGRIDAIGRQTDLVGVKDEDAHPQDKLLIVDWKTSNAIYADYIIQMAAYRLVWEENYPDHPIQGFHLCRFAKEQGDFAHHYFPALDDEAEAFLIMRDLFNRMKMIEKRVK